MTAADDLRRIHQHLSRGEHFQAETIARAGLRQNPFDGALIDILGLAAHMRGDASQAIEHFKNAASLEPSNALFLCHLALAYKASRQTDQARATFERALAVDPQSFEASYNYALLLHAIGESKAAIEMGERAVKLDPKSASAHNNLGVACESAGDLDKAIRHFEQAIRLSPDHVDAHANLVTSLAEADQLEKALAVATRALKRWPGHADLLNGRVVALMNANRDAEALKAVEAVLAADPSYAQAHYSKGTLHLRSGDFATGLAEYEWRVKRKGFWPKRTYSTTRWSGEALAGKTLLVHWEQGYGDVIQFSRYIPLLRAQFDREPRHSGARIIFDCPKKLIPLMASLGGFDEIGDYGDAPPPHDAYIPIMSLAHALKTERTSIPKKIPYLYAPDSEAPSLSSTAFRVGLTWASEHGASYTRKVCRAADLAPLFEIANVHCYGLQFGEDAAELSPYLARGNVTDLSREMGGFERTASLVAKMDLIISIDTYIVHLAGATGCPAWVMLPFSPDWRWGLDGSTTPWYPTLTLFRQPRAGDWKSLVAAVGRQLREASAEHR